MQNVVVSTTNAISAVFDTITNTADAVNGLSEAAKIRSESFAKITAIRTKLQEDRALFECDVERATLDIVLNDPEALNRAVKAKQEEFKRKSPTLGIPEASYRKAKARKTKEPAK